MPHPLVLAIFPTAEAAAGAARALHDLGISRDAISVVARNHDEESALARVMDATPGVEMEDSRPAARLGEIGAAVIAAAATFMPGVGTLVAVGPLSAEFGEAAGHLAGGLAGILERAGVNPARAAGWQEAVSRGEVLIGIHAPDNRVAAVEQALASAGAGVIEIAAWEGDPPG